MADTYEITADSMKSVQNQIDKLGDDEKALKTKPINQALNGGCLILPHCKLLAQAKASIVSSGRFEFAKVGINVQTDT